MRVLFDHNVNRRFRTYLTGHDIRTAREMGWETMSNGALLKAAADAGFQAFISVDKKLEHEQNLAALPVPVIIIDAYSNALRSLIPFAPFIETLLRPPLHPGLFLILPEGDIVELHSPRQ